jgi:hypothetical protein
MLPLVLLVKGVPAGLEAHGKIRFSGRLLLLLLLLRNSNWPGVVIYTCNPSRLRKNDHEFKVILGY